MNKRFILSLFPLFAITLSSCASSNNYIYDPEEVRTLISTFSTPDPNDNHFYYKGVSNIFNINGFEYFEYDAKFDNNTNSNILDEYSLSLNSDNWFAYKGIEQMTSLYVGDICNIIYTDNDNNYVMTDIENGEAVFTSYTDTSMPRAAINFQLYEGTGGERSFVFYNDDEEKYLALDDDLKFTYITEINEYSSFSIMEETYPDPLDDESTLLFYRIRNVANYSKVLNFDLTNKTIVFDDLNENIDDITSNLSFYVTVSDGKKRNDPDTVYGALSSLFIIRGSNAKIAMEEIKEDLTVKIYDSYDPQYEMEMPGSTETLPVKGGLHISIKNASCMVSLYFCHYADGQWTDVDSVWARWNLDLYYDASGLLVYEKIHTNNFTSGSLHEALYVAGIYTYGPKN